MHSANDMIDETAAADMLAVSPRTLQSWRVTGEGPTFFKLGRAVRYRRADLSDWIAASARRSTADTGEAR